MKKVAIWCVFFAFLCLLLVPRAGAQTAPEGEQIKEELNDFQQAIPPEVADLLPDDFFASDPQELAQAVGEASSLSVILGVIGRLTGLVLGECLALLASICGVLVLSAVFRALCAGGGETGRALGFCSTLALTALILVGQRERLVALGGFFLTVRTLAGAMLPLMGTLYAMGGNVGAAVANSGVMSGFLAILETLFSGTALPVAMLCIAFALLDALAGNLSMRSLGGLIKRTYTLGVSFLMLLLCGVLGVQSTLAKASDTLALRTARFAAGSFLPVVGGSVGEALRTVAGSVDYLRGVVGTAGLIVLFFAFLPTFLTVLLTRVTFLLSGAVAKLFGCEGEEKLLTELGSVWGYFLAVIGSLFVMMTFSLTLFARCAAAGA